MTLLEAARQIDAYAGECAEADVQPLGTVAVPVRYLQALRKALMHEVAK